MVEEQYTFRAHAPIYVGVDKNRDRPQSCSLHTHFGIGIIDRDVSDTSWMGMIALCTSRQRFPLGLLSALLRGQAMAFHSALCKFALLQINHCGVVWYGRDGTKMSSIVYIPM